MNRRTFLQSALSVAAASQTLNGLAPRASLPPSAVLPPEVDYFTRERMERLVDTSVSLAGVPFEVVAFNFPNYHPSAPQEKFFGKGWTEWELLKRAKPMFEGHQQPRRPLWGCFNEADPVWAEREIDAASSAGIHVFMVDWYWYQGTILLNEQLEQGFLKAPNRSRMRFAINWVNESWNNQYPPPDSAAKYSQCPAIYPLVYSEANIERMMDYCLEHYFHEPNYWRIHDLPVFLVYHAVSILEFFGTAKVRKIFDNMRNQAVKSGLKGLHIQGSNFAPGKTPLREAGFDSVTDYHTMSGGPAGKTSTYAAGAERAIRRWNDAASKLDVTYFPDCPVGWDDSSRYTNRSHVIVNRTPDQYELLLQAAKYHVVKNRCDPPVVYLSSWNEWSEDHYLLPDDVHGYGYLEAVKRQFGSGTR